MGNNHSGYRKRSKTNVSIYDIIKTIGKNSPETVIKQLENNVNGSISPSSQHSFSSNSSSDNGQVTARHSNLSLNLECKNYDIIKDLRISDKSKLIDHIDLMVGHRRFTAVRDGPDLLICMPIPKFILSENSPLRLDVYPKTQENPREIKYRYNGYTLNNLQKAKYLQNRIEDDAEHILYTDGVMC